MFRRLKEVFFRREKGQALVQFAILFPILFLMLNIVVDTWRVVDAKMLVQSAASEVAVYMVELSDNPESIDDYIFNALDKETNGRLDKNRLKISISSIGGEKVEKHMYHKYLGHKGIPFDYVYVDKKIVVEYDVKLIMPLSKIAFKGDTFKVTGDFITRVGKK